MRGDRRARGTRPRLSHPLVGDLGSGHAVGRRDRRRRVVRLRHGPQHQFVDLRYVVDGDRGPEVVAEALFDLLAVLLRQDDASQLAVVRFTSVP